MVPNILYGHSQLIMSPQRVSILILIFWKVIYIFATVSHRTTQADLQVTIFLHQASECWGCKHVLLRPSKRVLIYLCGVERY